MKHGTARYCKRSVSELVLGGAVLCLPGMGQKFLVFISTYSCLFFLQNGMMKSALYSSGVQCQLRLCEKVLYML